MAAERSRSTISTSNNSSRGLDRGETEMAYPQTPRPIPRSRRDTTPRSSVIFTPPILPSASTSATRGNRCNGGGRNILAPLRLNLEEASSPDCNDELADQLKTFIQKQQEFNEELKRALQTKDQEINELKARSKRRKLPKQLTANVREVYRQATESREDGTRPLKWDFDKFYSDMENSPLNSTIFQGVRSTDSETPSATIKAAIRVHFRSKRKEYLIRKDGKENTILKAQRRRTRLNSKKTLRTNALRESTTISEQEKLEYSQILHVDYMSSEHSGSEEEGEINSESDGEGAVPKGKVLYVSRLPWRSDEANAVLRALDQRVNKRRGAKGRNMLFDRKAGANSERGVPDDAPAWAVKEAYI